LIAVVAANQVSAPAIAKPMRTAIDAASHGLLVVNTQYTAATNPNPKPRNSLPATSMPSSELPACAALCRLSEARYRFSQSPDSCPILLYDHRVRSGTS
jgi:hypothetical protein